MHQGQRAFESQEHCELVQSKAKNKLLHNKMFIRNFLQIPKRKFFTSQVAFSSEHLFDRVNCLSMKRSSQLKNKPCLW